MNEQQNIEFKLQLHKFLKEGIIKRIGPAKGGYWEAVESFLKIKTFK
ncbi:MAG TPA: hypothetical protein PK296_01550 [Paludibacteraceae bacterium]|nr:hypothetical protein [Paludibacteraceae bacterium]